MNYLQISNNFRISIGFKKHHSLAMEEWNLFSPRSLNREASWTSSIWQLSSPPAAHLSERLSLYFCTNCKPLTETPCVCVQCLSSIWDGIFCNPVKLHLLKDSPKKVTENFAEVSISPLLLNNYLACFLF